ncbi:MAG: 7-cyano-7-deazaguanine synthase [Thiotrichaceae bacterium]|nr:7-cyano-7-deazaguanine synthase [Thiotrichaceae bacterium]
MTKPFIMDVNISSKTIDKPSFLVLDCFFENQQNKIELDYAHLVNKINKPLNKTDIDMLVIAAVVAFADRKKLRPQKWARQFKLKIPVYDIDVWQTAHKQLFDCLNFLTGDRWHFEFIANTFHFENMIEPELQTIKTSEPVAIIPFSGGLDSLATLHLFRIHEKHTKPLLITVNTNHNSRKLSFNTSRIIDKLDTRVSVSMKLSGRLDEISYRSRVFVFFMVAAITARLSNTQRIIIGENGQGSIGAPLVSVDYPYHSLHFGFTKRLHDLLSQLWDNAPFFEHPYIWQTKAEVLQLLLSNSSEIDWNKTISCSRLRETSIQCGICSNCLLRRLALTTVGLENLVSENYLWQDLNAPTLEAALKHTQKNLNTEINIASRAIVSHEQFRKINPSIQSYQQIVCELEKAGQQQVEEKINRLIKCHTQEWEQFLNKLNPDSWVVKVALGRA